MNHEHRAKGKEFKKKVHELAMKAMLKDKKPNLRESYKEPLHRNKKPMSNIG